MLRDRRPLVIVAAFALVFLVNLGSLGFRSEDWYMLPPFGDWFGEGPGGWLRFAETQRIQFTTFWVQGLLLKLFGFTAWPQLLFLFLSHLAACLLGYRALSIASGDRELALTAALAALVMPTLASEVFYITHAFFVFPAAVLMALANVYLAPLKDRRLDLAALVALGLIGQFGGEQTVPLFYACFLLACRGPRRERGWVPLLVCGLALGFVFYRNTYRFLVDTAAHETSHAPWLAVLSDYLKLHAYALYPGSWLFGRFSQPPSAGTWLGAAGLALLLAAGRPGKPSREPARVSRRGLAWGAAACMLLYLAPILLSTATGYRPGAAPKYLYASGFCMALLLALALRGRLARGLVVLYLGFLTLYSLRDVWGAQKRLDERLWASIEAAADERVRFLQLEGFEDWRSSAYSDFLHEGAAVPHRYRLLHGRELLPVRSSRPDGKTLTVVDRLGNAHRARPEELLIVSIRPRSPSFANLVAAPVEIARIPSP